MHVAPHRIPPRQKSTTRKKNVPLRKKQTAGPPAAPEFRAARAGNLLPYRRSFKTSPIRSSSPPALHSRRFLFPKKSRKSLLSFFPLFFLPPSQPCRPFPEPPRALRRCATLPAVATARPARPTPRPSRTCALTARPRLSSKASLESRERMLLGTGSQTGDLRRGERL